ncbi:hypothetical protein BJP36_43235 [Moorena producens JHB]|uniref:Uncharacterized protein n=1 Tax=Moorena producens (strain JHB) TaxID=1454205 RepID=A0A9Q9ST55_MOOP1|nr:hypothetical protein [Moorena producens]WAN69176.1 hypothetical protein BJP36_43235 [Moorena producens JHB]
MGNRESGMGNREQGIGNREQGIGNGEREGRWGDGEFPEIPMISWLSF